MHQGLRRKELCDPKLCHDSPGPGIRCGHCPLDRLDAAKAGRMGQLMQRALDISAILNLGVTIGAEDLAADELYALLVIEDERDKYDDEKAKKAEGK